MRRRNPEGETVILLGAAAAAAWWLWQRSQGAPAAGGLSAPAAASIVASAITAAGVAPPATLSTTCTGPVGQQTCSSEINPAWQAYQLANQAPELAAGQVNAGDVLVNGVWTGPGTLNPQAGKINWQP